MSEGKRADDSYDSEDDSSTLSDSETDSLTPDGEDDSSTLTGEESDEFELDKNATLSNVSLGQKKSVPVDGEHYDEAMELSASEQSVMSDAGPGGAVTQNKVSGSKPTTQVDGEHYDEAMELSVSESMMSTDDPGNAIVTRKPAPAEEKTDTKTILNAPHDEEIDLSSESELSDSSSSESKNAGRAPAAAASAPRGDDARGDSPPSSPPPKNNKSEYKDLADPKQKDIVETSNPNMDSDGSISSSDTDSDTDTSEPEVDTSPKKVTPSSTVDNSSAGAVYNQDYSHLKVSSDIKQMFKYIANFKPIQVELESKIKCFIPDFMPAVGTLDNFVKVPRPDSKPDQLGLAVVDEPAATQSDATVLELQFLSTAKTQMAKRLNIRSIERAEKSPAEITRWIQSIADLHRDKPPPTVTYKKPMPDIESLMQVWPEEFENELKNLKLPPAEIDLTTKEFASISCGLVDIPVHGNSLVPSLHVLFTLYSEFRSNQHFTQHLTENADEAVELSDSDENPETPPQSPDNLMF